MCGLIGAVVATEAKFERQIGAGIAALRHRGPDHQEVRRFKLEGRRVWLGHTRLSVIDLDRGSDQPMCSDDGRYALVFNGEIYNYIELREELRAAGGVFHTRSDTEVLLKAWAHWGESCLDRLDGMFAFVVLDIIAGTLTCARDPFGIKPFFYTVQEGTFCFASEMPAILDLLPINPHPDLQRGYDYLVHGDYDSNECTFIEGVKHLMPAHVMTLDVGRGKIRSIRRWWQPNIEQSSSLSFEGAAEAVREQFLQNVRRQLRSDVPLGVALSGGIDSSAVVCAIRHLEPDLPIHTFSFSASDSEISEESWIDLVNGHVGSIPHKICLNASDLARDIDNVVRAQGEPFGSTSIYAQYRVFQLARESGITVTLDGQGADELLAGYFGYPDRRVMSYLSQGHGVEAFKFARAWRNWPGRSYKSIAFGVAREMAPKSVYELARKLGGREDTPSWINADRLRAAGVRLVKFPLQLDPSPRGRRVVNFLRSTLLYGGLPSLLRHGDRDAMHFSIESRVPFLTTGLCNLLYALPEEFLISPSGETKSVFRAAMRGIVPDPVLDRRDKIGFATPERKWFTRIAPVANGWLGDSKRVPMLNAHEVSALFDAALRGTRPFDWQVWRLVNYIRWWNTVPVEM